MNPLVEYFNLIPPHLRSGASVKGGGRPGRAKQAHWLPQYLALVLGIIVQPLFAVYQHDGRWTLDGIGGRALFAVIAGIIIFPAVYKSAFDPEKPLFVQLCAIFVSGVGWESLVKTATGAAGR